jgi:hypothetical protein
MDTSEKLCKVKIIDNRRFRLAHTVKSLKYANKWVKKYDNLYFVHLEKFKKYYGLKEYSKNFYKKMHYITYYNVYISLKDNIKKATYCELFKEVSPRVRVFQNDKCIMCGATGEENNRKLNVHHVFYEKKTCCWIDENDEYWTNLGLENHEKNYYIGPNPNYFALLCDRCHGTTNGNFRNRSFNANTLRDVIDFYFGGKSYYTEEEMIQNGYVKTSKTKWRKLQL